MNHLLFLGRLTKDPVLNKKTEGKNSCFFTLAIKRQYKNSDGIYESDFVNCIAWNITAERLCEYCRKGDAIAVKAHIQNNNYIDKDDNQVYRYEIVCDQFSFVASNKRADAPEPEEVIDAFSEVPNCVESIE